MLRYGSGGAVGARAVVLTVAAGASSSRHHHASPTPPLATAPHPSIACHPSNPTHPGLPICHIPGLRTHLSYLLVNRNAYLRKYFVLNISGALQQHKTIFIYMYE